MGITSQRACARTRTKSLNQLIANFDNATSYSWQLEGIATQWEENYRYIGAMLFLDSKNGDQVTEGWYIYSCCRKS